MDAAGVFDFVASAALDFCAAVGAGFVAAAFFLDAALDYLS